MNTRQLLEQINKMCSIDVMNHNQTNRQELEIIKDRVKDNTFRIAVVGEFSSGKSTFINALIGKDLLIHAVNETTATITRLFNVEKDDPRIGTCVIAYRDGGKITINDIAKLYEYTTAQSSKDVANTIYSVSVYMHFMDVAYPLEIIDTPGLNGIADKHREITVEEVKKAHTCIYLLSVKGIRSSDVDFIRILQEYQSRFIFVQNFADQLKTSEGDCIENKLASDRQLIDRSLKLDNGVFEYDICGISALKRLCAKDNTIKKLYSDDSNELTEADRKRIDEESYFSDFEKLLADLAYNEKYKEVMIESAIQALNNLIDRVLPNIIERQEINLELRKQDDKAKRIEKTQQIIEKLELNKENHQKKLANFIVSRDKENRKGLKEYSLQQIKEVYNRICEDIDKDIQSYEDYEEFALAKNESIPVYYEKRTESIVNRNVIPELDSRISDNLSHLYNEAAQRVMEYAMNISGREETIDISIEGMQETFNLNDSSYIAQIEGYKYRQGQRMAEGEAINEALKQKQQELDQAKQELQALEKLKKQDEQKFNSDIRALGRKPDIEKISIQKEKKVKRGGLFGSILDFFDDGETVYYEDVQTDDSQQREWIKKYNAYTTRQQQQSEQHNRNIIEMHSKIMSLQNSIKKSERENSRIQDEIQDLEGRIQQEQEIYDTILKSNRREFCKVQKDRLKSLLENRLLDRSGNECTIEKLEQHIDKISNTYIKQIGEKITLFYTDSVKQQIQNLKNIIDENNQALEEQYNINKKDIEILTEIKKAFSGMQ